MKKKGILTKRFPLYMGFFKKLFTIYIHSMMLKMFLLNKI